MSCDFDWEDGHSLATSACCCAGQLTAALATGKSGAVVIFRTGEINEDGLCLWSGRYTGAKSPIVAVAGLVAEYCGAYPPRDATAVTQPTGSDWEQLRNTELGKSMPFEQLEHLVYSSLDLLQKHDDFFIWTVHYLLEDLHIDEDDALAAFSGVESM